MLVGDVGLAPGTLRAVPVVAARLAVAGVEADVVACTGLVAPALAAAGFVLADARLSNDVVL